MIEKSLGFILFIVLGVLLQRKITGAAELKGIKVIILSVALPAMIFVALLSIRFDAHYLYLPVAAIGFNLFMLLVIRYAGPLFGLPAHSASHRTAIMMVPSLAPGLSCFPFLAEFMGEEGLALGALADVGNKIFVLIFLYLLAVHWLQARRSSGPATTGKLKSLLLSMINEPINLVIIVALMMVAFGLNMNSLPGFLQEGVGRMAMIMTPLVLIFIGMTVRIKWSEFKQLFFLLTFRSGVAFLLSALIILAVPGLSATLLLLAVVFPQSATSFWPYAHMCAIDQQTDRPVFDQKMAISMLACSLPFSTLTMLVVFSFSQLMINPWILLVIGVVMLTVSFLPWMIKRVALMRSDSSQKQSSYGYAD